MRKLIKKADIKDLIQQQQGLKTAAARQKRITTALVAAHAATDQTFLQAKPHLNAVNLARTYMQAEYQQTYRPPIELATGKPPYTKIWQAHMAATIRLRNTWRAAGARDGPNICRHEGCNQPETMEHHLVTCQNHVHQQLWNNLCHNLRIPTNQGRPTPTTARLLAFTLGKHATNPLTLSQRQATILRYIRDVYKHRFKTTNTE